MNTHSERSPCLSRRGKRANQNVVFSTGVEESPPVKAGFFKPYKRWVALALVGLFFVVGLTACSTPPKSPDTEQIRKKANEGMQDLKTEEQRQKQ